MADLKTPSVNQLQHTLHNVIQLQAHLIIAIDLIKEDNPKNNDQLAAAEGTLENISAQFSDWRTEHKT